MVKGGGTPLVLPLTICDLTAIIRPAALAPWFPDASCSLTNLGIALRIAPGIAGNIREVLVIDKEDKFLLQCIKQDPEAAQIVMESGVPISFIPADWKSLPEQSERLNQPGRQFSVCLAKGTGAGMLIPTGMPGKVRFYREEEEKCAY